ncbi:ABC transporter ATPase [Vibrio cholerae]|uniref:ABC transporter ATPase n=1 Tax=Vibrio cholerae TaxID=666 RepID=UPI00301D1FA2
MYINNILSLSTTNSMCAAQVDPNHGTMNVKEVKQGVDVLPTSSRKKNFLSKIKSSPNGYKEKSPEFVKMKASQGRQERSRLSSIESACARSFDGFSEDIKISGMKQHFLSYAASIMDRQFSLICSQSENGKQSVEEHKSAIRIDLIKWLFFDLSNKDPKEIWASSANKSHIENGLRNTVDSLKSPGLERASKEERRKAQQYDYQALTDVSNKLLDKFNLLSDTPLRSLDNQVITSRSVERQVYKLLDKYIKI